MKSLKNDISIIDNKNHPECTICKSKEFFLVETVKRKIMHFNEKNQPLEYGQKKAESLIKCAFCGNLLISK